MNITELIVKSREIDKGGALDLSSMTKTNAQSIALVDFKSCFSTVGEQLPIIHRLLIQMSYNCHSTHVTWYFCRCLTISRNNIIFNKQFVEKHIHCYYQEQFRIGRVRSRTHTTNNSVNNVYATYYIVMATFLYSRTLLLFVVCPHMNIADLPASALLVQTFCWAFGISSRNTWYMR